MADDIPANAAGFMLQGSDAGAKELQPSKINSRRGMAMLGTPGEDQMRTQKITPANHIAGVINLVAGIGFEPMTFRL
ncbi:hypothetical protein ACVIIW_001261 [Bradyrhizobium sp. USDA 4449]